MWYVNRVITPCFDVLFSVMESWPGLLSMMVLASVTGLMAMLAYRYTSNQDAIGRVHDQIRANLLTVKLFKDDLLVTFRAQGRLLVAAVRVFLYSLQPLAVMIVPMVLLICQMAQRFEYRALAPGELIKLTVGLSPDTRADLCEPVLQLPSAVAVVVGPCRDYRKHWKRGIESNELVWHLRANDPGRYLLNITIDDETVAKELVVSDNRRYERVSRLRPGGSFWDRLMFPVEEPAGADAAMQNVEIDYPANSTPVLGMDLWWLITYFIGSMIVGLILMPVLKVRMW